MKNEISLLAGLKNNLEYSKNFYYSTREIYPDVELVLVSYNSTDGTDEWLDSLQDDNLIYFHSKENKTFADTFNKCTQLATKKYVAFTHNDVVLTPNFIETLENQVSEKKVIYYTTIEPPIFSDDEKPGKIIRDFGVDVNSLNKDGLFSYSLRLQNETGNKLIETIGTSFFLCTDKQTLLTIGGLDPLYNPMFCEDDDLVLRLRLYGVKTFIALNAICYHFVSKTSRFSEEYKLRTKQIEENSNKNFVRKWGFKNSSPIKNKYNIGFIVKNGTQGILAKLEPWCSTIYIDCDMNAYIETEQPNTAFSLTEKIKPLNSLKDNDILINIDGNRFKDRTFNKIQHLNEAITNYLTKPPHFLEKLLNKNKPGFKTDILQVQILNPKLYQQQLIINKK